jgi:hypothetical protein
MQDTRNERILTERHNERMLKMKFKENDKKPAHIEYMARRFDDTENPELRQLDIDLEKEKIALKKVARKIDLEKVKITAELAKHLSESFKINGTSFTLGLYKATSPALSALDADTSDNVSSVTSVEDSDDDSDTSVEDSDDDSSDTLENASDDDSSDTSMEDASASDEDG